MEHNALREFLFQFSEREKKYQQQELVSKTYGYLEKIHLDGEEIYVFDNQGHMKEALVIVKQKRFVDVPKHIHTFIEMNYVYSGKCHQVIDGKSVEISEGECCIIDTQVPHSIFAAGEEDIIINILIRKEFFSASFLSRLSNKGAISDFIINAISDIQAHDRYIIFHSHSNKNLSLLVNQLLCEYFDPNLCSQEMINCYMVLIFSELIRVFHYDSNKNKEKTTDIINILHYIEESSAHISLTDLAEEFNYNPNYLSSLIKKETGKNFLNIIQQKKMSRAAYLLVNSDIPIYQIATDTGQNNLSYFYKKFQNKYGMTPMEYRQNVNTN